MKVKEEIKQKLCNTYPKWDEDRIGYEAEVELRELADKGNEEAIRELSKRAI